MKVFNSVWNSILKFGKKVGEFNSMVLLGIVYILGIGFSSVFAKILRKHFLDLKLEPEKESYWIDKKQDKISLEEFKRSF